MSNEQVNHPKHYGGADNTYEAIKVIEAWELGFCLGNTIKYISRAGKSAHPQMRALALDMLKGFKQTIPVLFDDIYPEAYNE